MSTTCRSTLIVYGRHAMREARLVAARSGQHGLQIMSFEQAAVRLAGGFARAIDEESLRAAIQTVLPETPMGEFEDIKMLPGMIGAAADTLHKAWRAGIDFASRSADHPRLEAIARLEAAVLAEDRLIPDHIIPTGELDPLPVNLADRRDFDTILATTGSDVVLSRARRDSDGRLLGRSPLLATCVEEAYLRRNAVPAHAFSETDRLMARPQEFAADPQALSARSCWRDWHIADVTAHDGLVRSDHPLVLAILARTQSASSLKTLLRSPLNFLWRYALGWKSPQGSAEPLVLDALQTGDLIHGFCQRLIKPYPAEADIDPGAAVIDRNQADLNFLEIVDGWLRERLSGDQGGVLAEMVLHNPGETVALMHKIAEALRRSRNLVAPEAMPFTGHLQAFQQAADELSAFMQGVGVHEPETEVFAARFSEMAAAGGLKGNDFASTQHCDWYG